VSRQAVVREQREKVLLLTLNRPEKKNAFDVAQWHALADALEDARGDDGVACVVVTGAGGDFSAGQDLSDFGAGNEEAGRAFPHFMDVLVAFDKPLLAAVRGVGVGIGATLPLHCDVVYLGESARLRFPFAALGLVPEAASSLLLPLLIGPQPAAEVLLSAEWVHAPRALELGLAARVLPDAEVLEATLARAAEIAVHPVGALRAIKQLLLAPRTDLVRVTLDREMKSMAERVGTPENLEALRAFFARKG
jgi:enoyl-CoA hydratase/carnithine racemase